MESFFRRARVDRKKWTRLARSSGVSRSTIARWEEGGDAELGNFCAVVESAGYTLALLEQDARQFELASRGIRGLAVAEREPEKPAAEDELENDVDRLIGELTRELQEAADEELIRAIRSEILRARSSRGERKR